MDNGNTSASTDRKRMNANTVWQWRIMHVKKYSRNPEPFHYSNTMGLDFNVGITTDKKLDLQSVTNGVILEICDFAKTVKKSRRHFATSILENNYDLGLENEQQRIYFTNQLLHKLKDLRRKPPTDEVFPLFEAFPNPECPGSKKNRRQVEMRVVEVEDDSDPEDMFICSQPPSQELIEETDESLPDNMEDLKPEPVEKPKPDVLPFRYSCCEEIGLSFDAESKQILDPGLLTKAAMWELVDFTIVLTASYRSIILAVLEHNFNLNLKSQQGKNRVCFLVSQLLKRRKQLHSTGIKISSKFQNELFSFQSNPLKRSHGLTEFEDVAKRKMLDLKSDISWLQGDKMHKHVLTNGPNRWDVDQEEMVTESNMWRLRVKRVRQILLELDMEYCPFFRPKKIDLEFNIGFRPERYLSAECLTNSVLYKVARFALAMSSSQREFIVEILENNFNLCLHSKRQKFTFGCKVMSKVRRLKNCEDAVRFSREVFELPLSASSGNSVNKSKSSVRPETSSKTEMKAQEAASSKAPDSQAQTKPDAESKPDSQAQTKPGAESKPDSQAQTKPDAESKPDSQAQTKPDAESKPDSQAQTKPDAESKPDSQAQTKPDAESKPDSKAETEPDSGSNPESLAESEPDSGSRPVLRTKSEPDSESEPDFESESDSHNSVGLYPFCREIGLNLHENSNRSNRILDINKLTKGAMMEVADFAEQLCGTFEQICLDVLRHNFDLNLKSIDSELFRKILAHIPAVITERNLATCVNHAKYRPKRNDDSVLMKLDYKNIPDLEPCSSDPVQANTVPNVSSSTDVEQNNDPNLLLWKLRTNRIHQILSVPHGERCPLYSFPRCKKLGINFNVGSGHKQNLDPKFLTNGVMVEVNAFAAALQSATKHFMAEIIEYNFHLRFKGELHRSAFAERLLREILLLKSARSTVPRQNTTYNLPDPKFIEEESPSCPRCYQDRKYKRYPTESDRSVRPHVVTDTNPTTQQPAKNPAEEKLTSKCNNCRRIGLHLCLDKQRRKYKLDPDLLTCKVMMEVYIFARKLSGTKHKIVNDVLEHNFNIDMHNQDINPSTQFSRIAALNGSLAWFNEMFVIQPCSHRDSAASNRQDLPEMQASERKETCRKRQMEMLSKASKRLKGQPAEEGEEHYMCPLEGDEMSDSENSGNEDLIENPTSSHVPDEAQSTAEGSPAVNTHMNQPDQSGLQGDEAPTQMLTNVPTEYELRPEGKMWRLRSNRVKEILALIEKDFSPVFMRKKVDLEFNAGFGPRQNFNGECLTNSLLYKITGFALAMSSSQREFIVEILENNFDLNLQSKHQKYAFGCEVMKRLRRLKNCKDEIRFEVFGLPVSLYSVNTVNQSMNSVRPELSNMLTMKEHEAASTDTPESHARTEPDSESKPDSKADSEPDSASKGDSQSSVELYPFCKEIGLNLHEYSSRPNPKLDISKLTKGAMIEVVDFAGQLCGTFEQICLDVLRHNFDLDLESTDSDLFRKILTYIPALVVQRNLATSVTYAKTKPIRKDHSVLMKMQQQNRLDREPCRSGSVQANTDKNVNSSTNAEQKKDPNSLLWKLRINRIRQILLVPHGKRCPLYSFSRCKKLGIKFNVGSGRKQNLDPKLLTNGIMVELNVFAEALQSAIKDFMTDIMDYNFNLNLSGELHRSAFALQLRRQVVTMNAKRASTPHKKMLFELPDSSCMEEETLYCPSCYRDRNYKPQTNVSANAQIPASTFRAAEEILLTSYRHCKEVGLSLCVDKSRPKRKLDTSVLTWAVMSEVYNFCKKLSGTKNRIVNEIVEHNFSMDLESQSVKPYEWFSRVAADGGELAWFDEVLQPPTPKYTPRTYKSKVLPVVPMTDRKERFRMRQLEMQTKKERATLENEKANAERLKQIEERNERRYPICRKIGLDLDIMKQTAYKKKLHLRHLTRNVMMEIHSFIFRKGMKHFQTTLYEILNYNFDLSSQDHRRWDFAHDIATKVKAMIKDPKSRRRRGGNVVFKLPFVHNNTPRRFTQIQQNKSFSLEEAQRRASEANQVQQVLCFSDVTRVFVLNDVQIKEESWLGGEDAVTQAEPATTAQMNDSRLYGNLQIKEEEFDPHYAGMVPELQEHNIKTESNTDCESAGSASVPEIKTEAEDVQCYIPPAPQASEGSGMLPPNSGVVDPLQLAASLGYTMVTIGQDTLVKEEQQEGVDSTTETKVKEEP